METRFAVQFFQISPGSFPLRENLVSSILSNSDPGMPENKHKQHFSTKNMR
jgi:hypothetical protein